jgi:formylglycine-generating enzyme required for sulfatase activity
MGNSIAGRADLVASLRLGSEPLLSATAALLDFERIELPPEPEESSPPVERQSDRGRSSRPAVSDGLWTQFDPLPPCYWQLVHFERVEIEDEDTPQTGTGTRQPGDQPWRARPATVPVIEPLATQRQLLTRLRKAAGYRTIGQTVDIPELVDRVSRCELLDRIPLKPFRVWGSSLHVIQDRSRRLTPCWSDQDLVCRILKRIYPPYALTISRIRDEHDVPQMLWPENQRGVSPAGSLRHGWQHPPATTSLLVLGDLGSLLVDEDDADAVQDVWLRLGRDCRRAGNRAMALIPCRPEEVPRAVASVWHTVPWEDGHANAGSADTLDRLMTLVSPAVRLEPGLLRQVRRHVLAGGFGNPGLEARVWQHEAISSRHSVAASFDPDQQLALRAKFDALPDATLRREVLTLIRDWRGRLHEAIWFEEILGMDDQARHWFVGDVEDALHMLRQMGERVWDGPRGTGDWPSFVTWARGVLQRIPADLWRDQAIGEALHAIHAAVTDEDETDVSPGFQPARVRTPPKVQQTTLDIRQRGAALLLTSTAETGPMIAERRKPPGSSQAKTGRLAPYRDNRESPHPATGSLIGSLRTRNGALRISAEPPPGLQVQTPDPRLAFWASGNAPAWAIDWGTDAAGAWCTFRIGDVQQRLRWIPAGNFLMGSPQDEAGRDSDEGPQQPVTITHGFWMFDTPCTQALWEAVTGENPGEFDGPQKPVEQVDWSQTHEFIEQLNQLLPGLELRLPTEAEWEYACRAGNPDARYGELDDVAWHPGNSDGSTHDVAQKQPNAWGLHDMLGNVWERCIDHAYREYSTESVADPRHVTDAESASRVVRGGSWRSAAQYARAAYRYGSRPESRWYDLGFRCLSSPSSQVRPAREAAVSGSALSVAEQRDRESEPPPSRARRTSSTLRHQPEHVERLNWQPGTQSLTVPIQSTQWLTLESDLERVVFALADAPEWATESGQDRHGIWADLTVNDATQRLRWIPPGEFLMGSPGDEQGRLETEGPQHPVTISRGFWMFDTPCTQALWEAVTGGNPSDFKGAKRPVENVSWPHSQNFIERLNGLVPGMELRLPTDAEWEYACRAGNPDARHGELDDVAWHSGNSEGSTHDVGEKQSNAWGFHDMLGNVWEWCADHSRRAYSVESVVDPLHVTDNESADRVVRGGSWLLAAQYARAAYRFGYPPEYRWCCLGFRCLSSPSGQVRPVREAAVSGSALSVAEQRDRESEQPPSGARKKSLVQNLRGLFRKE